MHPKSIPARLAKGHILRDHFNKLDDALDEVNELMKFAPDLMEVQALKHGIETEISVRGEINDLMLNTAKARRNKNQIFGSKVARTINIHFFSCDKFNSFSLVSKNPSSKRNF